MQKGHALRALIQQLPDVDTSKNSFDHIPICHKNQTADFDGLPRRPIADHKHARKGRPQQVPPICPPAIKAGPPVPLTPRHPMAQMGNGHCVVIFMEIAHTLWGCKWCTGVCNLEGYEVMTLGVCLQKMSYKMPPAETKMYCWAR